MSHPAPPGHPPPGHPPPGYPPAGYPPPGYPQRPVPRKTGLPGWAIAVIVAGGVLMLLGVLAAVAIPSFMKYMRRAKTTEAAPNLKRIFDGARSYYETKAVLTPEGDAVEPRFPATVGLTPTRPCCRQRGKACRSTDWGQPTWKALGFEIDGRHYFQYRFSSRGQDRDAMFTAGAYADLDCDRHLSTYERTGTVDAQGRVVGGTKIYIEHELE